MNKHITSIAIIAALPVFIWFYISEGRAPWDWRIVLTILIISPVAEEIIFRGVLQDFLMRWLAKRSIHPIWAVISVSLLFALLHLLSRGGYAQLLVFFPSMILGYHYMVKRSLATVILLHAYYNIAVFL